MKKILLINQIRCERSKAASFRSDRVCLSSFYLVKGIIGRGYLSTIYRPFGPKGLSTKTTLICRGSDLMKAAILLKYGSAENFEINEMPEPTPDDLKNEEVLVNIKASSVNPVDYKVRNGRLRWIMSPRFPKIMGSDFSGVVVASKYQLFKPGDEIYGYITTTKGGAYAEKLIIKGKKIGKKPANLSHQETAALPIAGITALQALRDLGKIKAGDRVLINGCGGGVGHLAVQIAKYYKADVTGICSTSKVNYAKSIGVDKLIDYKKENIYSQLNQQFSIIFDTVGALNFKSSKQYLTQKGIFIATNVYPSKIWAVISSVFSKRKAKIIFANANRNDFEILSKLAREGYLKPFIDKEYPINAIIEAQKHVENGHTQGKVVITI